MKTTCYYYILKAVAKKAGQTYTYYKIGEADMESRPDSLCKKYTKTDNKLKSTMTRLLFEELPTNKVKRLNDKTIHANIDPAVMTKVDRNLIFGIFGEVDGYNEFFELKDSTVDVVLYIKDLVAKLGADDHNFTAKAKETSIRLSYADSQAHCVKGDLLRQVREFGKLNLNREEDKNILLIGQFAPSWVATFAMENNVTILHDSADQEIIYTDFIDLTKHINYIQDVDDLFEGDFKNVKFDLIIANPPYGKTGANITKKIIDNVEFDQYINLLPANDYKRNTEKNLYNYQSDMISIKDGFADAAVTTHLAKIHKTKVNNMTLDEFERSQYIDRQLDKYFEENSKRSHYAIDNATYKPKLATFKTDFDLARCLFIGKRYVSDEHLPYTKKAAGYLVNKERNITHDQLISMSAKSEQANGNVGDFSLAQFNTVAEQNNITDFLYSTDGFRFIAKVLISINADSYCHMNKFIPKVDWTRSWTVEEILADYGYTEDEIKEVMEDLKNYKGMEN